MTLAGSSPKSGLAGRAKSFAVVEEAFRAADHSWQTFLQMTPRDPATANTLVVALHGHGSHQDQMMTPGIYADAFGRLMHLAWERNLLYIAPEYRGNSWMNRLAVADIRQIIGILRSNYPVQRVILLGGSMGATSALIYAMLHPAEIDAVVAACPATDMELFYQEILRTRPDIADAIRASYGHALTENPGEYRRRSCVRHPSLFTMPVRLIHGAADALISVEHSRRLARTLRARGTSLSYIELAFGDHDTPIPHLADALEAVLE